MSGFAPSPDQARAITTTDRDLCVTASAGSGKTFTLARRFYHLVVEEGVDVGSILTITFTEKAASEMKERIARLFEDENREQERREVEAASISTIHGFCARTLREHAIEAGVDPQFAVLEEIESSQLRREALAEASVGWREDRGDEIEALRSLRAYELEESVLDVHDQIRAAGFDPAALDPGEPAALSFEVFDRLLPEFRDLESDSELTDLGRRSVRKIIELIETLPDIVDDPDALEARVGEFYVVSQGLRKPEAAKDLRTAIRGAKDALKGALFERAAHPAQRALIALLADLETRYRDAKNEAGYVDFADLELRALGLFRDRPDVAAAVRARHPHLLVDEYQDVSRLQAELLDLIRTAGGHFTVGDVKQSIYGFRHADIEVIRDETERVGTEGSIVLAETYRSRQEVLDAIDATFRPIWTGTGGAIAYVPVEPRGTFTPRDPDHPCVELLRADGPNVGAARRGEAALVADRIVELCSENGPPLGPPEAPRRIRYGDVAILLRAMSDVKSYERALLRRNVPYHVVGGRGFWEAREIGDLANLLRVVAGPGDPIPLASVLRSPLVGLSDDALLRLTEGKSLERRIWDSDATEGLSDDDAERLSQFVRFVRELRFRAPRMRVGEIVDTALEYAEHLDRVVLQRNGRQRIANLRKVRALARDLDGKGLFSLDAFIELIQENRELTIREAEAAAGAEDEDVVRLMSIHRAKGLEFPVVFLADLGRGSPSDSAPFRFDPEYGIGVSLANDTPNSKERRNTASLLAARERIRARDAAEARRVLYVGMTRAAEHLVMSAAVAKSPRKDSNWAHVVESIGADPANLSDDGEIRMVDSLAGRVRLQIGTADADRKSRMRAPLTRPHGAAIEAALPIGPIHPDQKPPTADEIDSLIAAADDTPPTPDWSDYLVTVTDVLAWARDPAEFVKRRRVGWRAAPRRADPESDPAPRGGDDEGAAEPDPVGAPVDPLARGRAAHRFLEIYDPSNPIFAANDATAVVAEEVRESGATGLDPAEIAAWGTGFHAGPIGVDLARARPRDVRREAPFLVRLPWGGGGGTLLRGTIDLFFTDANGGVRIVDYKTGRVPRSSKEALARPGGVDVHLQLRLYALAWEWMTGSLPAAATLWSLPEAKAIEVDLSPEALASARELLEKFVAAMALPVASASA